MKHDEIYDKHSDRRKSVKAKKKTPEQDKWDRKARVSFKNYVRNVRDEELASELDDEDDLQK